MDGWFDSLILTCGVSVLHPVDLRTHSAAVVGSEVLNMLKLLLITLTFYEFIVHVDAFTCPKGQRVAKDGKSCDSCQDTTYQPEENRSQRCKACGNCDAVSGSVVKEKCTKTTNTKCQCRGEFVPYDPDSSTCKCDIGFGLQDKVCSKCEDGYFSTNINSPCIKWKECKSGVNINGTNKSDVVCNDESKSNTYVTTPLTTSKTVSLMTRLTSKRPHEGAKIQKMRTTTTTTTSAPRHPVTTEDKIQPSNTGNYIGSGMALLIVGIAILLILTLVTCKLHIIPCMEKQPAVKKNESCRRPVEESGDDSLSSLKLNPGEP
ncbi:tumor necrosis factor receptor superfamily member 4 [Morone saxatilis]|uniref:tumor necrosis factor receptor superfamily member 4 n=1 Tax=Morone saxatilis TaxID=34816 RepID=UPI0015E22436|nr:tumor necrosis factor receptor superfamily member 4 [Morone saxatilis]